jgi:hypothetical protein
LKQQIEELSQTDEGRKLQAEFDELAGSMTEMKPTLVFKAPKFKAPKKKSGRDR